MDLIPGGLQAQKVCFDSGSDAVQALVGGSIDAFVGAGEHVIDNRAKGLDVKGYAVVSEAPPYSLVSAAGSGVHNVGDLAGKSVAVTAPVGPAVIVVSGGVVSAGGGVDPPLSL